MSLLVRIPTLSVTVKPTRAVEVMNLDRKRS